MQLFRRNSIFLLVFFALVLAGSAQAITLCYLPVICKDTALGRKEVSIANGIRYFDAYAADYDGCLTEASRKFDHYHALVDFPISVPPELGYSDNQITAAEVDARFLEDNIQHVLQSTANTQFNCHGRTTGRNDWPETSHDGIDRIVEDEFRPITLGEHGAYRFAPETGSSHSFTVVAWRTITEWDERKNRWVTRYVVGTIEEKWITSPVMRWTWQPGRELWPPGISYNTYLLREQRIGG